MKKITLFFSFLACAAFVSAQTTIVEANFATYNNGALAGQNGWVQYNTQTDNPVTVSNGKVSWTGNGLTVVNNQDVMLPFSSIIEQPITGTTIIFLDAVLTVNTAGATPSYILAMNTFNTTVTKDNFPNARFVAQTLDNGFVFGARVNGQNGYPFGYGTTKLTFGTKYAVRLQIEMVSGNANDVIKVFVGSDFNSLALHATGTYTTGTVADPTFGALLISQFASATAFESGVVIEYLKVSNALFGTGVNNPTVGELRAIVSGKNLLIGQVTDGSEVEIFSALGSKVQTSVVENGKVSIANLKAGVYVVRAGKLTQKIKL